MAYRAVSSLPDGSPCHEPHTHTALPRMPRPTHSPLREQRRDGVSESRGDAGGHDCATLQPRRRLTGSPQSPGLQTRCLEKRKTLRPGPCLVAGGLSHKPLHVSQHLRKLPARPSRVDGVQVGVRGEVAEEATCPVTHSHALPEAPEQQKTR